MRRDPTILFLNAGRRVELMQCFRDAFKNNGLTGRILATDIHIHAPAWHLADEAFLLPQSREESFLEKMSDLCRCQRVDLIVPLIDPDLPVLAGACSEIESTGAKLLISSEKAIEICQNKQLTAEFLGAQGLPIVPTLTPADISETDLPLIAKPRSGSASENVFKITEPLELEFLLKRHSDLIIQRHLSGPEYTVDVFCHFGDGKALSPVPRRRLKVRGGEVSVGCIERNAELETLTRKAVELVGIRGPANVQFILADSGPRILEINARFGGGCPLSLVGGAKYVEWCIDVALRRPLQCEEGPIRDGLTMMRYDASLFI